MTFPDLSAPGATRRPSGPAHARALRGASGPARLVGMLLVGLLSFGAVGGATAMTRLTDNIETAGMSALGTNRPKVVPPKDPNAGAPLNIVVMGSDSRDGDNGGLAGGGEIGARSDTTMVMHISGDRSRMDLVSIPRDTTVDVPSCTTSEGATTAPLYGKKFNAAFSQGVQVGGSVADGALCTVRTIEELTGVYVDGFVVVDFAGFSAMVDAVGGVDVCVEEEIYSPDANHLSLSPGIHTLKGQKALDYARARKGDGLGDGSDLGRIGRQQEVMASLARKVLSQDVLTNPAKTLGFLDAVTRSLTMNEELGSISGLSGLAYSLRDVRPDTITFMTVPNEYDPYNAANVVWTDEAATLWDNVKHDRPLDAAPGTPSAGASPTTGERGTGEQGTDDEQGTGEQGTGGSASPDPEPSSTAVKHAGEEAFTGADTTKVCG